MCFGNKDGIIILFLFYVTELLNTLRIYSRVSPNGHLHYMDTHFCPFGVRDEEFPLYLRRVCFLFVSFLAKMAIIVADVYITCNSPVSWNLFSNFRRYIRLAPMLRHMASDKITFACSYLRPFSCCKACIDKRHLPRWLSLLHPKQTFSNQPYVR